MCFFIYFGCERVDVSILDDHSAPMEVHEPVDVKIAFGQNVLPILTARCALSGCHIADGPHGLDFRTYESFVAGGEHGPVFLAGNADESEIIEEIVEGKMPPPHDPLPDAELQVIIDWINQQEHQDHVETVSSKAHSHTLKIVFMVAGDRISYLDGAEMAVAEINANGGLLGNAVELLTYINIDSKLDVSLATAEKWIRADKIIGLIGPNRSTHAIEVGRIAQRHKIPMVTTMEMEEKIEKINFSKSKTLIA